MPPVTHTLGTYEKQNGDARYGSKGIGTKTKMLIDQCSLTDFGWAIDSATSRHMLVSATNARLPLHLRCCCDRFVARKKRVE
jgi:hypothetical protein